MGSRNTNRLRVSPAEAGSPILKCSLPQRSGPKAGPPRWAILFRPAQRDWRVGHSNGAGGAIKQPRSGGDGMSPGCQPRGRVEIAQSRVAATLDCNRRQVSPAEARSGFNLQPPQHAAPKAGAPCWAILCPPLSGLVLLQANRLPRNIIAARTLTLSSRAERGTCVLYEACPEADSSRQSRRS